MKAAVAIVFALGSTSPAFAAETWNSGEAGTGWTLSGNNLTATKSSSGFSSILSTPTGYTLGTANKKYFEINVTDPNLNGGQIVGISNTSGPLSAWLGSDSNSSSAQSHQVPTNAYLWLNVVGTPAPEIQTGSATSFTYGIAVDFGGKLLWATTNGTNWNVTSTDSPTTPSGGFDISGLNAGSYYMGASGDTQGGSNLTFVLVATPPFTFTVPTGYSAWQPASVVPERSKMGVGD